MKQIYTLLAFNFLMLNLFGQTTAFDGNDSTISKSFDPKLTAYYIQPKPHTHDQCYTTKWCSSRLVLYNNEVVNGVYLQYNGFNDSFIGLSQSELLQIRYNREMIKEVSISIPDSKDSLLFKPMKVKQVLSTDSIEVFINVLHEGKLSFYSYRKYEEQNDSPDILPAYEFFLKKQGGQLQRIKLSRHSFLSQFPDQKRKIRKLIRENGLNLRDEKGMTRLVQLYNLSL